MNPADWEWLKSRFDLLGSGPAEERVRLLEAARAERPDLTPTLESMLAANTETLKFGSGTSKTESVDYARLWPPGQRVFVRGDVIAGRYRVLRCIGAGGMGEVYEVEDGERQDRGPLALKTVRSDLLGNQDIAARFEREGQHALELAHPNVCRVYDIGRHSAPDSPDVRFLTMRLLSGGPLSAWMKDAGGEPRAAPEAEALPLIRQMIAGLAAIHAEGIIHRDFKPLNVMLVPSGSGPRAVITDFGLARAIGDQTITRIGAIPGTVAYMAPELDGDKATVTCAVDVYALGVTMLQMLTGRSGVNGAASSLKTAGVSSRLTAIVLKCLEPDTAKRYRDAGEVAVALDPKPLPRVLLRVAALVLLGFSVAWGGYYWWSNRAVSFPEPARNAYQRGIYDMQSGSFYAAAKKFQEALRVAPEFTMAHVRLAEAWLDLEGRNLATGEMVKAVGKLTQEEQDYSDGIRHALVAGEADKSVESFRAYAAHATDAPAGQLALAHALERTGRGKEARPIYEAVKSRYPWASLRMAVIDAKWSDWDKANAEFDAAIEGFQKDTNSEGETEAIYQRGAASSSVALDTARSLLSQVLERVKSTHNEFQQVRAQIDLSYVELKSGHNDAAIALAKQAMQSATDQHVDVMYSRAYRSLGSAYSAAGDYRRAEPLLAEAARLFGLNADSGLEATALIALSDLHNHMGRSSEAAQEAEKALAYFDRQKSINQIVLAARAAANAYRDLGQFQKAADLAGHALTAAITTKKDSLIGDAHEAVGRVEWVRQRFSEAASHLRLAIEANTRAHTAVYIPTESMDCGAALAALGRFAEAARLFDDATRLAADRKDLLDSIRIERASLEVYRGNAAAAIRLVSAIPPDDSDVEQTAQLALIRDAAQTGPPVARAQTLLKLDKDGVSIAMRRSIHFTAATDLYRGHDIAGAEAALGPVGDYSEMTELNWRALLLASRLKSGDASAALRSEAARALAAASPFLGYSISGKTASPRLDLRDELREMAAKSSGN